MEQERDAAAAAADAVRTGRLGALERILDESPELATVRIDGHRTLLHVATDWPGHFPGSVESINLLVERGANATLWQAAALGMMSRLQELMAESPAPTCDDVTNAFWCACHGGQRDAAQCLLDRGARSAKDA